ncbi:ABC transporter AbcG5 [Dictyostelium purpureum]|uniref:ABC transporter AbcG5 n=1 Tax=Dictyostelium purpureum TaxID=5786 RepID=F1A157_DICPU|nr:ABC transporter AbcG5 [Dictyostelium purpureum]EGC30069.1 ABC transporter AbcG5 [Dictyostelium purpureum]|eukprot:XP_003293399.1 ABC transporter AbcG5 [Dictyostelium purpureum]
MAKQDPKDKDSPSLSIPKNRNEDEESIINDSINNNNNNEINNSINNNSINNNNFDNSINNNNNNNNKEITSDEENESYQQIAAEHGEGGKKDEYFPIPLEDLIPGYEDDELTKKIKETRDGDKTGLYVYCKNATYTVKHRENKKIKINLLDDVSFYLKPKEMTLILGTPGCGKSTIFQMLAGQLKDKNFKGELLFNGHHINHKNHHRDISYVTQDDVHVPTLTVKETFRFALDCQGRSEYTSEKKKEMVDNCMNLLGLKQSENTLVGNNFIRGISGGQKKRVTIGVGVIKGSNLVLMDEPTSGLDSSTSFEIMSDLKKFVMYGYSPALVTLLQPSVQLTSLFDNLMILNKGKVCYFGTMADALGYFDSLGFICPEHNNPAEFFQEVVDAPERYSYIHPPKCKTGEDFVKAYKESYLYKDLMKKLEENPDGIIDDPKPDMLVDSTQKELEMYPHGVWYQIGICLKRGFTMIRRNYYNFVTRIFKGIFFGLILGTLYWRIGHNQSGGQERFGLIFFIMTTIIFSSFAAVNSFFDERKVFYSQKTMHYYRTIAYFLSSIICDMPAGILEVAFFGPIVYWLANLRASFIRFVYYMILLILTDNLSLSFAKMCAAVSPTIEIANVFASVVLSVWLLFSGFTAPKNTIGGWWIWLYYISPYTWIFQGLSINEFTDTTYSCKPTELLPPRSDPLLNLPYPEGYGGNQVCQFTSGEQIINAFGIDNPDYFKWVVLGILSGYIVFFYVVCFLALKYLNFEDKKSKLAVKKLRSKKKIIVSKEDNDENIRVSQEAIKRIPRNNNDYLDITEEERQREEDEENEGEHVIDIKSPLTGSRRGKSPSVTSPKGSIINRRSGKNTPVFDMTPKNNTPLSGKIQTPEGKEPPKVDLNPDPNENNLDTNEICDCNDDNCKHKRVKKGGLKDIGAEVGSYLQFRDLCYSVDYKEDDPDNPKKKKSTKLQLLRNIDGYVKPGQMLALMGPSGAGKSTLLDVLAQRKTGGYITGEILINGQPPSIYTNRIRAYVEQMDVLPPTQTVREAIAFSARCRLPPDVTKEERDIFVDKIVEVLSLKNISNLKIGVLGNGLSVSQRKRVNIGVELASNPEILFLDEPTSGLDSGDAYKVIDVVAKIAKVMKRTVICTVHQPSAAIFEFFDQLLLLKKGGETVYFGPLGDKSSVILDYCAKQGMHIKPHINPADFVMTIADEGKTVEGPNGEMIPLDPKKAYEESDIRKKEYEIMDGELIPPDYKIRTYDRIFASSWMTQFKALCSRSWLSRIRRPEIFISNCLRSIFLAVLLGTLFVRMDYEQQDARGRVSLLFFSFIFAGMVAIGNIPTTVLERGVFYREVTSGFYHSTAYMISYVLTSYPFILSTGLLYIIPTFWIAGLDSGRHSSKFWYCLYVFIITYIMYDAFALCLAICLPNEVMASTVCGIGLSLTTLFGGFVIARPNYPNGWIWAHYLDMLRYPLEAACTNEFTGLTFVCTNNKGALPVPILDPSNRANVIGTKYYCPITNGDQFMLTYGFHKWMRYIDGAAIWGFIVIYVGIAFWGFKKVRWVVR